MESGVMESAAVVRRYRIALVAAVGAPVLASAFYVVHIHWWIATAEQRGIDTTDWGFAVIIALLLWGVSGVGALSALPGWLRAERSGARRASAVLVALVDVGACTLLLPPTPRDARNVLPCAVGALIMLTAAGWVVAAGWRRAGPAT